MLMTRFFLVTFLLVVCASSSFSQKRFCPKPPPSPFKHSGEIVTSFDASVHKMRATLEHPNVLGKGLDTLYLTATFVYQDSQHPTPPTLDISFISTSLVPKYRATHDLIFFCDGQQHALRSVPRYQSRTDDQGTIYEATRVTLSYEDLMAITHSKKVAARLGQTEFEMTNDHLEALRELVNMLAPSPGRWRAE